jgi:hypothetical protein
MEKDPVLLQFIADKRNYEFEEYSLFWIFESIFIDELRDMYGKKMISLEEKFENSAQNPPQKVGNFLMCGYAKKKFNESVTGES